MDQEKLIRTFSINLFTFPFPIKGIRKILNIKDDDVQVELNAICIMALHAFVEGALSQAFKDILESSQRFKTTRKNSDTEAFKVLYELISTNPNGLIELKERYNRIEIDISKIASWDSLQALSQFRNMVAHGGSFTYRSASIDEIPSNETGELIHYETIYDRWSGQRFIGYLQREDLIDRNFQKHPLKITDIQNVYSNELFSKIVLEHFIVKSKTFFDHFLSLESTKIKDITKKSIESLSDIL